MFKRLAYIATVLTLLVVVLGAYVRLSDAGLGCPDWPGCYGTLTVPQSAEALADAHAIYPDSPVEHAKAWKEMVHRYLAGILGLLVLALFVQAWRERGSINVTPWLPTALIGIVGFQAMLGMWTVTMLLKPAIVTMHLMGGMTTLAILTWITHRHWGTSPTNFLLSSSMRCFVRFALLILVVQIFLGGWTSTNYAALACTDFPTCHGEWVPSMDFANAFHWFRELGENLDGQPLSLAAYVAIQWIHRVGALITFLYVGLLGLTLLRQKQLRGLASIMLVLLVVQIGLGIANLLLYLPTVLAVAHNMVAALLLMTVVMINSKITE
ncbi:MAG: COX15/CtaA family protein [Methylophilaceae bacterium]|jgi:cytochrome c oxidase assembly protein subunit 15|nr:heme A synthase [Methylophilaceae bacterium]